MRGISPVGSSTRGRPRAVASAPRLPPAVSTTTGVDRSSAASAAESTSTVSPEYDEATTSACLPAAGGGPYPPWATIGTSSPPAAHPPVPSAPPPGPPQPPQITRAGRPLGRADAP